MGPGETSTRRDEDPLDPKHDSTETHTDYGDGASMTEWEYDYDKDDM